MVRYFGIIIIALISCACSDTLPDVDKQEDQLSELTEINEFILPDSLNVDKELVIAAYYEVHPKKACVIIFYNDTTQVSISKMSFLKDSVFEIKKLIKVSYNEFKIRDEPTENYTIKPSCVVWTHINGISAMTAEYQRVDVK